MVHIVNRIHVFFINISSNKLEIIPYNYLYILEIVYNKI
jgi:hypothetical protein